jgi:GNAT superfamily N-acetyltransferase
VTRIDRIRKRGNNWDTQDMLNWAAWQRMHVVDPQWRPDVIRQGGAEGMRWQRWASWQRGDPRWRAWVLDTTLLSVHQAAERVAAWVQAQRSDKWRTGDFWITDEVAAVDVDFFATALNSTYWAEGRPRDVIEKSLKTSLVFSLFENERQIGFTRVVSDQATFAWICDVYVHPDYRGRGLGKWLMECTLEHPSTKVRINLLATRDAHGLYEQFGFKPKECMIRRRD